MSKIVSLDDFEADSMLYHLSLTTRELLFKAFDIDDYKSLIDVPAISMQRMLLLSNSYGDFPPITIPTEAGYLSKWLPKAKANASNKLDLNGIVLSVASSIPDIAPTPWYEHSTLYRADYFIRSIRNEIISATMKKRNVPWNTTVSFTLPFIYKKGRVGNWELDNNILKSELIELVYNVYHFLLASMFYDNSSDFILLKYSKEDFERLGILDYTKDTDDVIPKVCELAAETLRALNLFDQYLRQIVRKEEKIQITPENLFEHLQKIFSKLKSMEQYVSLL